MDFEWEPSNVPVWLDSLPLLFHHKHSTPLTVFRNFKTPLLWLPTIQQSWRAALLSPQELSEG